MPANCVIVALYRDPGQRKAVMEPHIAEIPVNGDQLIPVNRISVDEFHTRAGVVDRPGLQPRTL